MDAYSSRPCAHICANVVRLALRTVFRKETAYYNSNRRSQRTCWYRKCLAYGALRMYARDTRFHSYESTTRMTWRGYRNRLPVPVSSSAEFEDLFQDRLGQS
jgi:hypothetical protein